jgi:hypothetical protein
MCVRGQRGYARTVSAIDMLIVPASFRYSRNGVAERWRIEPVIVCSATAKTAEHAKRANATKSGKRFRKYSFVTFSSR